MKNLETEEPKSRFLIPPKTKMPLLETDVTVTCPYDKGHEILVEHFHRHVFKCRKLLYLGLGAGLAICAWNSTHHVPKDDMAAHQKNCEDRPVEALEVPNNLGYKAPPVKNHQIVDNDETWDVSCPTYDPTKEAMNRKVLRQPVNMTKAERKIFYENEKPAIPYDE